MMLICRLKPPGLIDAGGAKKAEAEAKARLDTLTEDTKMKVEAAAAANQRAFQAEMCPKIQGF